MSLDSFLAKGQFLLHLISVNRKSYDIHVICYENVVSKYQTLFPSLSNIQYHDCMYNIMSLNLSLYETISRIVEKSTKKIVILIDSLSMYLLYTEFRKVYKELLDITSSDKFSSIVQFVVVIHKDVTEINQIEHLKNICKTHIHVQTANNPFILNLRLEHKRSNGKCVVQKLKGELKSDFTFQLINDLPPQKIEDDKIIPTNLASFKLDLQDSEKKAKEELILPYTLVQNPSSTGGMIHYVPDEADDWDEEDPDDDLEI
ncbi:PREDICTED: elongator complex protein 5 isoform X2 [Diuraphis noxia]|uniref:elongator complex protein 5 isoform X2 n=1 Tax=Diuraphis noxia TaxID=143948 RepID=UPI0007636458|nr:PREDICTED: elongator complex protein 5 isoform X2 [Diuraphis noxia]